MRKLVKALWQALGGNATLMHDRAEVGTVWRHSKNGHFYVIVGRCQLEREWQPAVQYVRLNNPDPVQPVGPIAREFNEFMDGRFQPVLIKAEVKPPWRTSHGPGQPASTIVMTPPPPLS